MSREIGKTMSVRTPPPSGVAPEVKPLIVQARVNENTMRSVNPHLPYSPAEVVEDGLACFEAGASVLHWHGRDEAGGPRHEPRAYEEVIVPLRERTDLILKPTLGYLYSEDVGDRLAHLAQGDGSGHPPRADLAAVDMGSVNVDQWDGSLKEFVPGDRVYENSRVRLVETFNQLRASGVAASCACWDVGQVRTGRKLQEAGVVRSNPYWEFIFTGDELPSGPAAEIHALQSFLAAIPPGEEWEVMCVQGDVLQLAAWAIALGGHVAIGLGDYQYSRLGTPTNADLISQVVQLAHILGRPVATPDQARDMLGVKRTQPVGG